MTTIETITDDRIEALSTEAAQAGDLDMVHTCQVALGRFEANVSSAALRATLIAEARKVAVAAIRNAESQA
jgi:hypothetical protein